MSAPHFFAPSVEGEVVVLSGDEAAHARGALRIRVGETITVSDGVGNVVRARVDAVDSTVRGAVLERSFTEEPHPRVTVMPAVSKSGKLDTVVQKLTELGVDEIHPWFAERTVVRWDAAKATAHGERWRQIAREASKQSRRARLPMVRDPGPIPTLLSTAFVLHEDATERLLATLPAAASDVVLVIGPEGGLSPEEVELFSASGARIAGLGPQVLRTETACLMVVGLVLSHYGRLG